jgi:chromosome segregation ATPase
LTANQESNTSGAFSQNELNHMFGIYSEALKRKNDNIVKLESLIQEKENIIKEASDKNKHNIDLGNQENTYKQTIAKLNEQVNETKKANDKLNIENKELQERLDKESTEQSPSIDEEENEQQNDANEKEHKQELEKQDMEHKKEMGKKDIELQALQKQLKLNKNNFDALASKHKETENKLKQKTVSELELRSKLESIKSRRNSPKKIAQKLTENKHIFDKLTEVQKQKNTLNPLAEDFSPDAFQSNIREYSPMDQNQDKKGTSPNTMVKNNPNLSDFLKDSIKRS